MSFANVYAMDHGHLEIACEHKGLHDKNGAATPESILNDLEFRILVCLLFSL